MEVTDLQRYSGPVVWKRAVFAVGFACFGCAGGAGVLGFGLCGWVEAIGGISVPLRRSGGRYSFRDRTVLMLD